MRELGEAALAADIVAGAVMDRENAKHQALVGSRRNCVQLCAGLHDPIGVGLILSIGRRPENRVITDEVGQREEVVRLDVVADAAAIGRSGGCSGTTCVRKGLWKSRVLSPMEASSTFAFCDQWMPSGEVYR